ncbi:hypothetical protein [Bradyrhizobium sp. CB1015]|uniref:hypothetical protein n=1 Tax=Bradyrhizobium sp. CB1015 TaxID=2976822 RepID=UPI0021AA559A|nr:hypothetical protein [Bradyrhizobium sp. CB1015]UWU94942.1 hypothetical protein N2604_14295 [Bradyrhizobium sp. CB1015]
MLLNAATFPIVRLTYDQGPSGTADEAFAAFEALLDRGTPFVIIGQGANAESPQHEHDADDRRRLALWSKKHKPRLREFVKALIYVEPSVAKRVGMKTFQMVSEKFWGYPMLVAASEAEALEMAQGLLNSSSTSGKVGEAS